MIEIWNVRYAMEMGCCIDVWRIHGIVDGEARYPSTPRVFNKNNNSFRTASGNVYQIMSFDEPQDKFIAQMEKDIQKGSYEIH